MGEEGREHQRGRAVGHQKREIQDDEMGGLSATNPIKGTTRDGKYRSSREMCTEEQSWVHRWQMNTARFVTLSFIPGSMFGEISRSTGTEKVKLQNGRPACVSQALPLGTQESPHPARKVEHFLHPQPLEPQEGSWRHGHSSASACRRLGWWLGTVGGSW